MRQRLRRLVPELLNSMTMWSWLGQVVVTLPVFPDDEQKPETPVGPPPGHPERPAGHRPMTPEEREIWANLEGTDR